MWLLGFGLIVFSLFIIAILGSVFNWENSVLIFFVSKIWLPILLMYGLIYWIKTNILDKRKENNKKIISYGNGCIASKKIFDENYKIGYMKREVPSDKYPDSGWRFFVGDEDEKYTSDNNNLKIYSIESIVKHDSDVEKYLDAPNNTAFIRINEHEFIEDDGITEIYISNK